MVFELCTDQVESIPIAAQWGFKRIELCAALSVGGLTPSMALIEASTVQQKVEVHVMIRPREGDFQYSPAELDLMKKDISIAHRAGATGVVFGCLNAQFKPDIDHCQSLLDVALPLGLECTFHRAFDQCPDPQESLDEIIRLGFDRLLTSGQQPSAMEGLPLIMALVQQAGQRIQIMAGGGILPDNAAKFKNIGVDAIHFTAHRPAVAEVWPGMGVHFVPDPEKMQKIVWAFREDPSKR